MGRYLVSAKPKEIKGVHSSHISFVKKWGLMHVQITYSLLGYARAFISSLEQKCCEELLWENATFKPSGNQTLLV